MRQTSVKVFQQEIRLCLGSSFLDSKALPAQQETI